MSTYLILPRKVKAVLAGKALSRKVAFELDLQGLARLNQAGEGKKEKKNSMRKSMEQESMHPIGGQEECGIAEHGREVEGVAWVRKWGWTTWLDPAWAGPLQCDPESTLRWSSHWALTERG